MASPVGVHQSVVEMEALPRSPGDTSETAEEVRNQETRVPGTPLGTLFRGPGAYSLASVSEEHAEPFGDDGSEAQSAGDGPQRVPRAVVSNYLREDPDVDRDYFEDDQGNIVSEISVA